MSFRGLALDWSLDGPVGVIFTVLVATAAAAYLAAARHGSRCDRRGRHWPRQRTGCYLAGLGLMMIDRCSGVGT
jgi:cytochrome c oxidase assembly factor CtaG